MRSNSLSFLALVGALFSATAAPDNLKHPKLQCRCLPSQPCWPTQDQWSELAQSVGNKLIPTKPVAYECHDPHYDSAKCSEIQKGYFFDHWRQHQPGAVQQTNFEVFDNQSCLGFNQTLPCYQGAVPLYTVNATGTQDVQSAIKFASKYNIRLVVKNTGHDYLGRSIGANSLNLWVYYMKNIKFDNGYVPEGAPSGTTGTGAVVVDSGVLWKDVYKAADEHDVIVVGGAEGTVGASGGYCQGGGHSPISPRHGLCVDNVLQYKVVTADGELKVANSYQNTDLFWALRGGGGGTFGVVVEATYKTHPPLKNLNYAFYILTFNSTAQLNILNNFFSHHIRWSEEGWSGYSYVQYNYMQVMYYLPDSSNTAAVESLSPFLNYSRSVGADIQGGVTEYPSFWANFESLIPLANNTNAGFNTLLSSRLIPRRTFDSPKGISQFSTALLGIREDLKEFDLPVGDGEQAPPMGSFLTHLVAGGEVGKGNRKDTSVLPAWRKALMHIVVPVGWGDTTPLNVQQAIGHTLTKAVQRLRDITPGSGAYFNEADVAEPNWQTNFFGANYPRLKSIKNKVDPRGLFACHQCVGSEDWNKDLYCPRRR
ncbi:hypothetical protein BGZ76_011660 [Entomortierella beljakovae]|nr:hypothetical protein BGZ76_011660 [Entomortierella beljakovae]